MCCHQQQYRVCLSGHFSWLKHAAVNLGSPEPESEIPRTALSNEKSSPGSLPPILLLSRDAALEDC